MFTLGGRLYFAPDLISGKTATFIAGGWKSRCLTILLYMEALASS
jgi:hypothetical protein